MTDFFMHSTVVFIIFLRCFHRFAIAVRCFLHSHPPPPPFSSHENSARRCDLLSRENDALNGEVVALRRGLAAAREELGVAQLDYHSLATSVDDRVATAAAAMPPGVSAGSMSVLGGISGGGVGSGVGSGSNIFGGPSELHPAVASAEVKRLEAENADLRCDRRLAWWCVCGGGVAKNFRVLLFCAIGPFWLLTL